MPDEIEFKQLDSKPIASDIVTFRLEDGATVKIRVDIDRAGIAINYKNPDGSPHYNIAVSNKIAITSPDKKFRMPSEEIKRPNNPSKGKEGPYK